PGALGAGVETATDPAVAVEDARGAVAEGAGLSECRHGNSRRDEGSGGGFGRFGAGRAPEDGTDVAPAEAHSDHERGRAAEDDLHQQTAGAGIEIREDYGHDRFLLSLSGNTDMRPSLAVRETNGGQAVQSMPSRARRGSSFFPHPGGVGVGV